MARYNYLRNLCILWVKPFRQSYKEHQLFFKMYHTLFTHFCIALSSCTNKKTWTFNMVISNPSKFAIYEGPILLVKASRTYLFLLQSFLFTTLSFKLTFIPTASNLIYDCFPLFRLIFNTCKLRPSIRWNLDVRSNTTVCFVSVNFPFSFSSHPMAPLLSHTHFYKLYASRIFSYLF